MSQLSNVKNVREILNRHGFSFSKKLGQNFIVNPSVCPRIAELGGAGPDTGVLEIGPGLGVLTWELASRARKVVAIELDERLLPVLEETLSEFDNVTVIQGDVLKIDLGELIRREFPGMEVVVCANLPYYITSPIVMHLLEARLPVKAITVMVQKEAADRICAAPGSRNAGALSAAVSYYASARVLFSVSRGSFMPGATGGFGRDPAGDPSTAGGGTRGRGVVFQDHPSRFFPAAQDLGEFPFQRSGPCQKSGRCSVGTSGDSSVRSGGRANAGRFLPA